MKKNNLILIVGLLIAIGISAYSVIAHNISISDSEVNISGEEVVLNEGGMTLGNMYDPNKYTLVGTSSNYRSVPYIAVFSNSTTTDVANATSQLRDGGTLITQIVATSKQRKVALTIGAIGGTATSTLNIRQMGSYDGTNFFNLASSTDPFSIGATNATSTIATNTVRALTWDPGVASSTVSRIFDVEGYEYTRFILWGDDLSTDPDDGIEAWVEAIVLEERY